MSRLFIAILSLLFVNILSAQYCGTPQESLLSRIDVNQKSILVIQRGAIKYIPVTFHLVAKTDGTGRIQEEDVFRQLASINEQYGDQEAIFYIDRLNYFDNDAVFNSPGSSAARTQMRVREDNNSVNVFITNSADNGGENPGITLAYYDPAEDWIVSRKGQINGASSTLAHETGHFFSLPHPHAGWDCHPYITTEYTNPVNVDFTIPCESGGGSAQIELQNGSNCTTTGDHICDTPPDYNLGLLYQNDCAPNTSIKDKNGTVITPMVNNFMGYYTDCADYEFSQTQKNLINTDFFTLQRAYIRTGKTPNTTPVEGPVTYISPINGQETPGHTSILLDWENEPGADHYLIIIDRFQSFTNNPVKYFVDESQVIIDELLPGVVYYWKVWPYNESQTGAGYGPTQNFKVGTGVGVNEISEINGYTLSPNPAVDGQETLLTLSSAKAFNAQLKVSDASGHVLVNQELTIASGLSQHTINTKDLPAGIYFVMLYSESGMLVERLLKN